MKCDLHLHLVTVTDHDSIDAAEALHKRADFFLSEEVSCELPSGTRLHVGVYNIEERDHVELQRKRCDFPALFAWLRERKLFFSVNHVYSSLTGPREEADFSLFARCFPAVEVLNGQMPAASNAAANFAARWRKAAVAGSDAHTIGPLASAYTSIPAARSKQEFLEGLSCAGVMLTSLLAAIPVAVLLNYVRELAFAKRWREHPVPQCDAVPEVAL